MKYPTQNPTSNQGKLIRAILTVLFAIALGVTAATAQNTVRMDENGNFVQVTTQETTRDTITGKTFTNSKGIIFEVFKGAKGGLYYWKKSKNGNWYKVYLKKD